MREAAFQAPEGAANGVPAQFSASRDGKPPALKKLVNGVTQFPQAQYASPLG